MTTSGTKAAAAATDSGGRWRGQRKLQWLGGCGTSKGMPEMFGQLGPTVEEGGTERASPAQGEIITSVPRGLRSGSAVPVKRVARYGVVS